MVDLQDRVPAEELTSIDGWATCNAEVTGRLLGPSRPLGQAGSGPPITKTRTARSLAPAPAALIAPFPNINDGQEGGWNKSRIPGILLRGTVSAAQQSRPEAKVQMRCFLVALSGLLCLAASGAAQANVAITVDKNNQMMTVAVDGVERYHWPVSTGIPSRETPSGNFRTFRMEEDHYSKEFDDAPMPHSIFFTKIGHAIHGTDSESRLGTPASHGCVRLSKANASTLYALVEQQGVLNTTVTLTGSAQVALARNPRPRGNTAVARRDPTGQYDQQAQPDQQYSDQQPSIPQYGAAGDPVVLTPQLLPGRRVVPQERPDDGYIYPADGSSDVAQYPAPRSSRQLYDAQAYPQQQQYYDNRGYAPQPAPQGYYQPRPYYQPRGLFN
jgi:L,D-transpeptidase-like protein